MFPRTFHHPPCISTRSYSQAAAVLTKPYAQQHPSPPQQSQRCIREQLRELLRETAQPVAVVTAFMPQTNTKPTANTKSLHHGATLSSFTSIAMDPYPLVTFALRIPSRMATTLNTTASTSLSTPKDDASAHMVINILSSTQSKLALTFSRPDLHPTPFADPDIGYTLSEDGIPVLEGSLGAISCRLVGRGLPLHDLDFLTGSEDSVMDGVVDRQWQVNGDTLDGGAGRRETRKPASLTKGAVASELFIAQVTRIEALASTPMLPLLYHRRKFTSCIPCPPDHTLS